MHEDPVELTERDALVTEFWTTIRGCLSPTQALVLAARYVLDKPESYESIGRRIGVSRTTVIAIEEAALWELRRCAVNRWRAKRSCLPREEFRTQCQRALEACPPRILRHTRSNVGADGRDRVEWIEGLFSVTFDRWLEQCARPSYVTAIRPSGGCS